MTSEDVRALIHEVRGGDFEDRAWMIDVIDRLADALEDTVREMHLRELHHFEEEQKSAALSAALEASAVSSPTEPSEAEIDVQVRVNMHAAWGDLVGFDDLSPEAQQMAREKARRDLTWAVSSPPTITDDMVERAKRAINEAGAVLYHETIRAALAAALHPGGETNGN